MSVNGFHIAAALTAPRLGVVREQAIANAILNSFAADNLDDIIGAIESIVASSCDLAADSTVDALRLADASHERVRALIILIRGN